MATRKENQWTPSKVRQRIQAGVLLERLQRHSLSEDGDVMTQSQVKAACYLLDQALGKATQPLSGDPNQPLAVHVVSYK